MDLVTMANEALAKTENAVKDMSASDRTRLINSSYYMGQYNFIMGILRDEDLDAFAKLYAKHKATVHSIFIMQEAI